MKKHPEREDFFEQKTRLAFPMKLTKAKEAKFAAYKKEPIIASSKSALYDLIPN